MRYIGGAWLEGCFVRYGWVGDLTSAVDVLFC